MTSRRNAPGRAPLPAISQLYRRVRQGQRRERNLAELADLDVGRLADIGLSSAERARILSRR